MFGGVGMGDLIFVLGGARSGKSTYGLTRAHELGGNTLFVATAQAFDGEMHERIRKHREERPMHWTTLEAHTEVGKHVEELGIAFEVIIVDCITLLASNLLLSLPDNSTQENVDWVILLEIDALLAACSRSSATWLVISNEVGMGVVPPTRLGRFFRDALGRANQRIASAADEVRLLVAGLPWQLK
jgi:adenosylcobinamide kinase / adenosylcobinamide-phosphate guanylyltransferase